MLVQLTADELRALVRDAVRVELAASKGAPDDWLDQDGAAALLGVKRSTIPTLCQRDALPHSRVGRLYRFRRSELETWLEERATKPHGHGPKHGRTLRAVRR